jgi:hypothetical protein
MREMGQALADPVADLAVQEIYQRARRDPSHPVGTVQLAVALFGERCIRLAARRELPGRSALAWPDGVPVIHLRRDLSPTQINHAVAHELGEWLLHMWGFHGPQAEDLSGRIGAALCVPRPAFHLAHSELGENVPALSQAFTVSESLMALRIAECLGYPTALVTPRRIRTRGNDWNWPTSERAWLALARRPDSHGLSRHAIRDARSRFVLRAEPSPR